MPFYLVGFPTQPFSVCNAIVKILVKGSVLGYWYALTFSIVVIPVNRLAPVAPVQHMIDYSIPGFLAMPAS